MPQNELIDLSQWYNAREATERLAKNSGRDVREHFARKLARNGKIRSLDLGSRAKLYRKEDVDKYCMGRRGPKPKQKAQP